MVVVKVHLNKELVKAKINKETLIQMVQHQILVLQKGKVKHF